MAYFEALSNALFKEDPQGNTVFYPWGVMGKGVILDSQERREAIVSFMAHYYGVVFVLIALMQFGILVMHSELLITGLWLLVSTLLMLKWYTYRLSILTEGLLYSEMKLGLEDGFRTVAQRMPRLFIISGFVMMLLLVVGCVALLFILQGPILWAVLFLLAVGLFGTYAYYRMMGYAKEAVKTPEILRPTQPKPASSTPARPIEWSGKNIALVAVVSSIMIGVVTYVVTDAQKEFDERMERYQAMSAEEMARYLATLNAEPERIDPITLHAGTEYNGTTIYFYRELSDNLLSHLTVNTNELTQEQAKMSRQLKWEMCGLPTYDLFYRKGGRLVYVYHHIIGEKKCFMFEIPIDLTTCS